MMETETSRQWGIATSDAAPLSTAPMTNAPEVRSEAAVAPHPASPTAERVGTFTFQGDALEILRCGEELRVGVEAICRALDVGYPSQLRKLRSDPSMGLDTAGCLPLRSLPRWLFTIPERAVVPAVQLKLAAYKAECAESIADHVFGKRGALPAGMRTTLETWTPERAAETQARRDRHCRSLAERTVEKYAGDMTAHRWRYDPHGLVIGPIGEPIDGNHRLAAVVKAGIPVEFVTTHISDPVLAEQIKRTIDTGRPRRVGDVLELSEGVSRGNYRAAIAAALDLLEDGVSRPLSVEQTRDILALYREGIEWAVVTLGSGEFNAPIRAAFVYAWTALRGASRSTEPIDALVHLVRRGAGELGSPAAVYSTSAKRGLFQAKRDRRAVCMRVLRVLKAQVCGEPGPSKLYADADGVGVTYFRELMERGLKPCTRSVP